MHRLVVMQHQRQLMQLRIAKALRLDRFHRGEHIVAVVAGAAVALLHIAKQLGAREPAGSLPIAAVDPHRPAPPPSPVTTLDKIITINIITIMTITKATALSHKASRIVAEPAPPPYRRVPAYLIRRLMMVSTAIIAEEFEDEDMPVSQWAVLSMVDNHPEIDQSRLAEVVSIDKTNTGRLVDQLEAKGLVERRPNDSDRRVWMLHCTPLGHKTRKRLRARALATQERLLSCLEPAQRELFIDLMSHVVKANEKYVRPGAGRRKPKSR